MCHQIPQKEGTASTLQQCRCEDVARCLSALAFLPVNEVTLGFGGVVAALEEKIQDGSVDRNKIEVAHLQYFENTYVGRVDENYFLTDALFPVSGGMSSRLFSIKRREPTMRWRDGIPFHRSPEGRRGNYGQLATRNAIHPADPLRGARSAKVENSERQIFKLVQDYSNADRIGEICPLKLHEQKSGLGWFRGADNFRGASLPRGVVI
uniref:Uncharacterized protein n=1 Tax=Ditylenchus dipsaci TaxID=166011 RepID=A0A915CQ30_9BILA